MKGLVVEEAPYPYAGSGDVVVRVRAASFTPEELAWSSSWVDRSGRDRAPVIPGHEVSGEVAEVAVGTTGLSVGQRVIGLIDWNRDGSLAEYVAVEARNLVPLPAGIDHVEAAALPMPGLTAWQGLFVHIIVRRERPHPGAQLSLFDQDEGLRHQVFLTDTPHAGGGSAQFLEVRHCGHATVEDHIRCGKTTGFGRFPSRHFAINSTWLELSLAAIDLLAWMRLLLLDGELATAEPKKLRYRLLHVAARLTCGSRRLRLRISATWPWRHELATAFHRLAALPRSAG
ncbi:hypothetical protein C4B68_27995 [Streptomyces dengpaensis]|uniref:Enoyl reductase (ER) domain-containing protein n=1 Tax=Streptomyces dengpaensis TaxID=2049881 RepID=A0ABN5IE47_9ACTN|nr:hypothetical protein C4B68_27995 [Streptomyces dengpaensis]